ncbi:MAPK regulated corepressor interacting protein 2 isoform X1 [Columba livia]
MPCDPCVPTSHVCLLHAQLPVPTPPVCPRSVPRASHVSPTPPKRLQCLPHPQSASNVSHTPPRLSLTPPTRAFHPPLTHLRGSPVPRAPALRCPHGPVPRGPFKGGGGVSRRPGRPVKGPARGARRTRAGAAGPEGPRPQDVHADARPQQAGHAAPHSPAQKLVFNRVNGKRPQVLLQQVSAPEECYTLAHEENVRFIYEAWQQVEQQLDGSRSGDSACGPVQYVEKTPNPGLKNFVPIDLEEWWAQQFLAKIENCS